MESTHYIHCRPSRFLLYLLSLHGILCLVAIVVIAIQNYFWLAALALLLLALCFKQLCRSTVWRLMTESFELRIRRNFTMTILADQLSYVSSKPIEVRILKRSRAFDFMIMLELGLEDGRRFLFPLLFDTMEAQDFRRLKVVVLYASESRSSNLAQNQHGK